MAILRDGVAKTGSATAATLTLSNVVCNGPNPILWVYGWVNTSGTLTATYNGVSMTNPTNAIILDAGDAVRMYMFYITGITGTHNVILSQTGGATIQAIAMAFSGAAQISGDPDNSGNSTQAATSIPLTLTTSVPNCWIVSGTYDSTSGNVTAGAGAFREGTVGTTSFIDSGPYSRVGSSTQNCSDAAAHSTFSVFASFAPSENSPKPYSIRPRAFAPGLAR